MGWISKAAKIGAKAVRNAPNATKEAQAAGEAWGRSSKIISRLRKGMLKENWRNNQSKRWAVNDAISDLRKYTGRTGNALAGKEMRSQLGRMKSEVPKAYQKIKDFVTSRGTGLQFNSVATGQRRKEASVLRTLRELGYQGKDPKRALKVISDLSKRNLLPAAAVGAGVTASRGNKKQGYAMGGYVVSDNSPKHDWRGYQKLAAPSRYAISRADKFTDNRIGYKPRPNTNKPLRGYAMGGMVKRSRKGC